ncbi:hypothetical protein Godav_005810 [Gossypium davidsonii]|uniref:Uncharacterized protein n=2 Tax=Gossypium TaxID=3633 RepID=A0A7J8S270_GOSDV|nr:hypothetical protein [Gossypium davidsonii]MBA0655424.1 hypothetical protein [Gossypium klotzschianum]
MPPPQSYLASPSLTTTTTTTLSQSSNHPFNNQQSRSKDAWKAPKKSSPCSSLEEKMVITR